MTTAGQVTHLAWTVPSVLPVCLSVPPSATCPAIPGDPVCVSVPAHLPNCKSKVNDGHSARPRAVTNSDHRIPHDTGDCLGAY